MIAPRHLLRLAAVVLLATVAVGFGAPDAQAHPLGNFTTNTFAALQLDPDSVAVEYVLDLAEIPALRIVQRLDADGDGAVDDAAGEVFRVEECQRLADGLELVVDGTRRDLTTQEAALTLPPGQAGLVTLRLECDLLAPGAVIAGGGSTVTLTDGNSEGRIGWREVIASGEGVSLLESDVPAETVSDRLRTYPEELLASPLAVTSARVRAAIGEGEATAGAAQQLVPAPTGRRLDRLTLAFTELVERTDLTVIAGLLGLLAAVGLGGLHAVAPGHGKTVMAAILVSRDGSPRQALALGGTVAVTHTLGVLLLGALLSVTEVLSPDRLYAGLGVASGLLFAAVGVTLLRAALQRRSRDDHDHGHGHPDHGHPDHGHPDHGHPDHGHPDHGHPDHDHHGGDAPQHEQVTSSAGAARAEASRWRTFVAPGLAGGLLPSPSALLVLLGGIALGRAWFGVALVVAYGIGMAGVLVGAGYLLVRARDRAGQRLTRGAPARLLALLPVVTASLVVAAGLFIAGRAALGLA